MMELLAPTTTMDYLSSTMNITNETLTSTLPTVIKKGGISCNTSYYHCALARDLWIVTAPIVLLLGTIGNILIICVMSRKPLRKTAFGLYLIAMAAMDLIFLWVGLTRHFVKNYIDKDVRYYHQFVCSLQRFLTYGSSNASVWLLTAVTLERTLAIFSPTRSIRINSLTKTKVFIAIIILVQFLWNSHVFFTRGLVTYVDDDVIVIDKCGFCPGAEWYYEHGVQTILAMLVYSVIPFIAMLSMNIAIFVRLHKRDKMYNKCATVRHKTGDENKTKSSKLSNKTLMLLPVTIFFLVTTLPHLVFTGIEEAIVTEGKERAIMELTDYFVSILSYLNHSLNFFLYCLTGRMFRARCWALLTYRCHSKEHDSLENYSRSPAMRHISVSMGSLNSTTITPQGTPRSRAKSTTVSAKNNSLYPPERST